MKTCCECGFPHDLSPDATCPSCGERVGTACRMCDRLFDAGELADGACEDCEESRKRQAKLDRARQQWEGRGDWLRDQQKDAR